jgi:hypothetical protein
MEQAFVTDTVLTRAWLAISWDSIAAVFDFIIAIRTDQSIFWSYVHLSQKCRNANHEEGAQYQGLDLALMHWEGGWIA